MSFPPTQGDDLAGFLDAASGLPLSRDASRAWATAQGVGWAEPTRRYPLARRSRDLLEHSRAAIASALDCPVQGIIFTPDPVAAADLAITGFGAGHLVISAVEALPVLRLGDHLGDEGQHVDTVVVDAHGRVRLDDLESLVADQDGRPATVCVQQANAEIGTRQDLGAIRTVIGPQTALVTDATSVLGRDAVQPHWDALWADPRMWGGGSGIGLLAIRDPDRFRPRRAIREGQLGVEPSPAPVAAIATAALSLESALADLSAAPPTMAVIDHLRGRVADSIPDVQILGHPIARVSHIAMFSFLYVSADELVETLGRRGWAVASGASCTSDTRRPHHVLVAIGASTHGSLRVSLPPGTGRETIDTFVADLAAIVAELREGAGVTGL